MRHGDATRRVTGALPELPAPPGHRSEFTTVHRPTSRTGPKAATGSRQLALLALTSPPSRTFRLNFPGRPALPRVARTRGSVDGVR